MRSVFPIPGNPWPHDMAIRVEDDPHQLLELLWARAVHRLEPDGTTPPPLEEGPASFRPASDPGNWAETWVRLWAEAVRHLAELDTEPIIAELYGTPDGSPERAALLKRLIGPNWRDRFGDAAFDDEYQRWNARRFEARKAERRVVPAGVEREVLDALIPAWRAGLTGVITIPCRGEFTRIAGPSALLVTDATRADPDRYRAALRAFAAGELKAP